jgi:hypothetical protein
MNIMYRIALPPEMKKFRIHQHIERCAAKSTNLWKGNKEI